MNRLGVYPFAMILAWCLASAANAEGGSSTVYVARRGWHIDIGVAVADLSPPLAQVAPDLPRARYVFFGFADKHYLLAPHHNAPVLLTALWPGAGIVLATGLRNSPAQTFGEKHVIALSVQAEQMRELQSFIWRSLRTQIEVLKAYQQGPYEGSMYFLAVPKYSAFRTCNTWGAEALRAADFHVHAVGVVFAWQLWIQVRRLKRSQDALRIGAPRISRMGRRPPELPCSAAHTTRRLTARLSARSRARHPVDARHGPAR